MRKERTILLTGKDKDGEETMDFPITKIENVEGGQWAKNIVIVDGKICLVYKE